MSAWVKKRKIWVSRLRSPSVSFCAQSRQSSPSGTSSGIQWICCWRFQKSNAQGYSNGLYCLRASRRGMLLLRFVGMGGASDGRDPRPAAAGGMVGDQAGRAGDEQNCDPGVHLAPPRTTGADAEEDDANEIAGVVPAAVVGDGVNRDVVSEERHDEGHRED